MNNGQRCIVAHVARADCEFCGEGAEQSTVLSKQVTDNHRMEARILGMISAAICYGGHPEKG